MKKTVSFIIILLMLTSCSASAQSDPKKEEYLASVRKFSWVSPENKPFLSENIFANECKMSVSDLNADGIPEIILTDYYSPSEANAAEVFSWDGELSSSGGFWGSEFSESGRIPVYETADGRRVIVTTVESEHGGMRGKIYSETDISDYSSTVICSVSSSDISKYYWINSSDRIDRDFIDDGFRKYDGISKANFDERYGEYMASLKKLYDADIFSCGTVSIGNLPTMEMLSQPGFDADDYIKHKDEPQSIEKSDEKAADSICSCISEHFFRIKQGIST